MKKVLIVVDMQNGFISEEKENYKKIIKKINNLIKKSNYNEFIFTKFKNLKNSFFETKLNWTNLRTKDEQEICVDIPPNSIIFEKTSYGLTNEQIAKVKALKVKQVDLCGLQTDSCVFAIALQLFDNKIFPNILINYCGTNPSRQKFAKEELLHKFGSVDEKK